MSDVIAAQATPAGRSALAIVRVSGRGSTDITESLMKLESGRLAGMRRVVGALYSGGREVDTVVAISWPAGKSYTGEEMVEIICHGVPAISREILSLLMERGAREAVPGEFTRRAFLAGAMGGVDVIALSSLWEGSGAGIAGAFREIAGKTLGTIEGIREELEGRIEFGESHGAGVSRQLLESRMASLEEETAALEKLARVIDGRSRVFIMGPRNSGKSTLFNHLTGGENAVVSPEPGTTRDGRSVEVDIDGRTILLHDTAGAGGRGPDREATKITEDSLGESDRVIWLSDGSGTTPGGEIICRTAEVIVVQSMSDLHDREGFRVSSESEEGIDELRRWLAASPGGVSLSGLAAAVAGSARETLRALEAGDEAVAAEQLTDISQRLRSIMREEELELCIERALSKLCIGK